MRATGLQWLGQLHALSELRGLTGLSIMPEGNPIHGKIWREYAVYRLAHWGQEDMSWRVRGRSQLTHAIELACGAAQRLRALELEWPALLVQLIEDALRDFAHMETHVKDQMRMLMDAL